MNPHLDHFVTFVNAENIDDHVEKYRALGFVVTDETRQYKPGLRTRYVLLGCEYLELAWVENEDEFAAGGSEEFARMYRDLPTLRAAARPFSIGFNSPDVEALHQEWTRRGFTIPPVWSFAPPGMPPVLSFQEIPLELLPGASCFALTYRMGASSQERRVQRAANTIYGVQGITFVTSAPAEDAKRWQTLLSPDVATTTDKSVYSAIITPHTAWWMPPEVFQERYGVATAPAPHPYGHLAAIHLFAENLELAGAMLERSFRREIGHDRSGDFLLVSPTGEDGILFIIREHPIESWGSERTKATGEKLIIS